MNQGHSPAPWSVPHFAQPDVDCACTYVLTDTMMGAVCSVHVSGDGDDWKKNGDNPKFKEAVANARLIAASPALLEALELVRDTYGFDSSTDSSIWHTVNKAIDLSYSGVD